MFQFFCIICTAFFVQFQPLAKEYDVTDFILNGQEAQYVNQNLIWLRCSAGQRWTVDETCSGQPMLLTYDEAVLASNIASEQLNGNWRLPSREELVAEIAGLIGSSGSTLSQLVGSPGSNIAGITATIEEKKAA